MDLKTAFPRNPDGTLIHKKPCQTPGCPVPNWHICLDKNDPNHRVVHAPGKRRMSMAQREAIAESQRERHAALREKTKRRDEQIIKLYTEDELGMTAISQRMQLAQSTVNKVVNRAAREGLLNVRPRGHNQRYSAK